MSATKKEDMKFFTMPVDMPGMGPGAETAGWWVVFLQDLMNAGKHEDVINFLTTAKRTGALKIIMEATVEYNRSLIQARVEKKLKKCGVKPSGTYPAVVTRRMAVASGCEKEESSEPYFYKTTLKTG